MHPIQGFFQNAGERYEDTIVQLDEKKPCFHLLDTRMPKGDLRTAETCTNKSLHLKGTCYRCAELHISRSFQTRHKRANCMQRWHVSSLTQG